MPVCKADFSEVTFYNGKKNTVGRINLVASFMAVGRRSSSTEATA
jgi:hypothetical protein